MNKSSVVSHGNDLTVEVGFTKIDEERREVVGIATTDKLDAHGEVIDAEASTSAFQRFKGSIREMHQPNAVGTLAKFTVAKVWDEEDSTFYNAIVVNARISKGAQNTWEKIMDGTLKAFSIGGMIKERGFIEKDGKKVPVIKSYDLKELSVVDMPANGPSTITSIFKAADAAEQNYNIFYQKNTGSLLLSHDTAIDGYDHVGFTNQPDDVDVDGIVSQADEVVINLADAAEPTTTGGSTMQKNNEGTPSEDAVAEQVEVSTEDAIEETVSEDAEKSAEGASTAAVDTDADTETEAVDTAEVDAEEETVTASDTATEVSATVEEEDETAAVEEEAPAEKSIEGTVELTSTPDTNVAVLEALTALTKAVSTLGERLDKVEDLDTKVTEVAEKAADAAERVEKVENTGAVKKSVDESPAEQLKDKQDAFWKGTALSAVTTFSKNN